MRFAKVFLFTAAAMISGPAFSSVVVVGNSAARTCYEAAESAKRPVPDQLRQCDRALYEEGLTIRDLAATHVNRGVLRVRMGRIDEGIRDFDAAMVINPGEPESYLNKGAAMMQAGRPDAAVPLFSMALERKTRVPARAYYGRGVANEDLGNIRSAYLDYQRASSAAPKWAPPREELARFMVRRR